MTATQPQGARGRHGLSAKERPDPIGYAVAVLNRLAQAGALDRPRAAQARRARRLRGHPVRVPHRRRRQPAVRPGGQAARPADPRALAAAGTGTFDLTPTEDEQMLVDVVREFAAEVLRPAAAEADAATAAPDKVLKAGQEIGLPLLGVPEELGGISDRALRDGRRPSSPRRWPTATWAWPSRRSRPGAVATALSLWGTEEQQSTYLPAFTGDDVPAAALALAEPRPLFDPLGPAHHGRRATATATCSTA